MDCRSIRVLSLVVVAATAAGAPAAAAAAEPAMVVKDYVVPVYTPSIAGAFYATAFEARDVGYVGMGRNWAFGGRSRWSFDLGGRLGVSDRPELDFGSLQLGLALGPRLALFRSGNFGATVFTRVNGDLAMNVWGADGTSHRADVTGGVRLWTRISSVGIVGEGAMAFPFDYPDDGERALRLGVSVNMRMPDMEAKRIGFLTAGVYWIERFDRNTPGGSDRPIVQVSVALAP